MLSETDVLVVGVGTMGSMALWRLARRGLPVTGIERFQPGHDRGSGHGESRMIRTAYYEGPEYVPLVHRSWRLWRELEAESGDSLLTVTGALMIGRPDGDLVSGVLRSARQHGLAHEVLDASEAKARYPQHRLQDGEVMVHEPAAGVLRPEAAIRAAAARARALGARLVTEARVSGLRAGPEGVEVSVTGGTRHRAPRAIVAAGAWLAGLLPELRLPLQVERQVMLWFPAGEPAAFSPECFPVFIRELGETYLYGLPSLDGATVKVAIHHGGRTTDPDQLDREVHPDDAAPVCQHVRAALPDLDPRPARASVCLYTNTPDDHFLVGPHPSQPAITVLGGFCGHGFKFAPVIGEAAAELALEGASRSPIERFSLRRFAGG